MPLKTIHDLPKPVVPRYTVLQRFQKWFRVNYTETKWPWINMFLGLSLIGYCMNYNHMSNI